MPYLPRVSHVSPQLPKMAITWLIRGGFTQRYEHGISWWGRVFIYSQFLLHSYYSIVNPSHTLAWLPSGFRGDYVNNSMLLSQGICYFSWRWKHSDVIILNHIYTQHSRTRYVAYWQNTTFASNFQKHIEFPLFSNLMHSFSLHILLS